MSSRGYFSLRYAVPGYTFILLLVAINFFPISEFLSRHADLRELASISGGILALLSGSTVGFLVSQPWWWWFHKDGGLYSWCCVIFMRDKFNLTNNPHQRKEVLQVFDYILHTGIHSDRKTKGLSLYAFRRWDMYVLLSCTTLSLILGFTFGFLLRVLSEYYFFQMSFFNSLGRLDFQAIFESGESWLLIFILASVILLVYFIRKERRWTRDEYEKIHQTIIETSGVNEMYLRSIFPPEYFRS
jgi:hypothetical protein